MRLRSRNPESAMMYGGNQPEKQRWGNGVKTLFGLLVAALTGVAIFGMYHFGKFVILWLEHLGAPDFINLSSIPVWIAVVILLFVLFGLLRTVAMYLANMAKFVFKIAQSDIVTVILAVAVNGILLFLNGWITTNTVKFIDSTGVENFFSTDNFLSVAVMFVMLACALIWIPRVGTYGENRLGQFDDD